jgi:iron complex transport system ATP-binding protein
MISVKNVSVGSAQLLKDISVTIPQGKLNIAIGRNGAGKSTFFKAICDDIPSEGKIYYDGMLMKNLHHGTMATRRAVVSQHTKLSFDFTVEEVVLMGRTLISKALEPKRIIKLSTIVCNRLECGTLKNGSFPTLSGGESGPRPNMGSY